MDRDKKDFRNTTLGLWLMGICVVVLILISVMIWTLLPMIMTILYAFLSICYLIYWSQGKDA